MDKDLVKELEFEKCCEAYMPVVYYFIKRWKLGANREEYEQVGRIAIYEAWVNHDPALGEFATYVNGYVSGRFKDVIKRQNRWGRRHVFTEPSTLAEQSIAVMGEEERIFLEDWIDNTDLNEKEKLWAKEALIYGHTPKEVADRTGYSIYSVKGWRLSALSKLRSIVPVTTRDL